MKKLIILSSLFMVIGCRTTMVHPIPIYSESKIIDDSLYVSNQELLVNWLMNQPQEVRDEFRRNFVFSGEQIQQFVDTLKKRQ